MMDAQTERAEKIFCAAYELQDAAERRAFVSHACDGDLKLRTQVEQMLAAQTDAEQFFAKSSPELETLIDAARVAAGETTVRESVGLDLSLEERPGARMGQFKLLQKLGEGGCGVVYMAEQERPVRRRVALKIIKLGMDTKSVIARFQAEQQALALMDHPNIAHVLDAGATDTGRPYFVMELVRGVKLTTFCDEHHLDARQRLRLFIQVCHAIQHAHQKGIIHRDIKPSNILVTMHDGVPAPKVIDFGIAKAVEGRLADQTLFTACDHFIGTPAYMSPEQAEMSGLDVDTRSDIYSLGVLLYELLTAKTPFDTKKLLQSGLDEMRRTLREREPERPSVAVATLEHDELTQTAHCRRAEPVRLISLLRGDLDWIVMKALEKDRARRYQTVNGLALDIQRYLNNEPVLARPPSPLYKFRKLAQRNKVAFVAAAITTVALIASSSVSTWLLFKERAARQRALAAEEQKIALEREAGILRETVENRQQLLEAAALTKRGELAAADVIVDDIPYPNPAPEHASMFRTLGDWHALNGRWAKAKARFDVLFQINEFGDVESTMDDIRSAVVLVDQRHPEEYERFRESLITRYAGTDNSTIAQRVIRECLLTHADAEIMKALDGFATVAERPLRDARAGSGASARAWHSYALALMAYRRGDNMAAIEWSLDAQQTTSFPTRDWSVQLIKAMALARMGRVDEARAELQACRSSIQNAATTDSADARVWHGFWFDKVCVQIHLREAEALIEKNAVPRTDTNPEEAPENRAL